MSELSGSVADDESVKRFLPILLLAATGCVSIGTHERMLRETRDREVEYAQKLAVELEHGEISLRDMQWLLHGRCE